LLTARIEGQTLRDKLIKAALLRKTDRLTDIFATNGAKMRRFHEISEASDSVPTEQFVERAQTLIDRTPFFSATEKPIVLQHVQTYGRALRSVPSLPLRKIHHDWTLRNILVDRSGVDYLVDFDSMRAPASSRWIEVTCLLLNLESQAKWAPLVTHDMLSNLWSAFWRGYVGDQLPEISSDQIPAVIFLGRLYHLLGGTFRAPLFKKYSRVIDRRFISALKKSVLEGRYSMLNWTAL
jgi:hypothetical protein